MREGKEEEKAIFRAAQSEMKNDGTCHCNTTKQSLSIGCAAPWPLATDRPIYPLHERTALQIHPIYLHTAW